MEDNQSSEENLNDSFNDNFDSLLIDNDEDFFSYSEKEDSEDSNDVKMEFDATSADPSIIPNVKEEIRKKIWDKLAGMDCLQPYPESCINRIPNFKGHEIAADKLAQTWQFRESKHIKVNPSLAQKPVRVNVLKYGKTLLVPASSHIDVPGSEQFYYKLESNTFSNANSSGMSRIRQIQRACSRSGVSQAGQSMTLHWEGVNIDLFVVGSVAVAANGMRLGNPNNYAELEWSILVELGVVDPTKTLVVTTIHEEQLLYEDELPLKLLEWYDLPVDLIITPKRIINISEKLPKPSQGIEWGSITMEMIQEMPILQTLKKT